ncbi:3-hydroxybutyryl-CoA dehydrogenase [Kibdelosporangium lantanae]
MAVITRVGVVGCGLMGAGIAEVAARPGVDVLVAVRSDSSALAGRKRIEESLDRAVHKGVLTGVRRAEALARIAFTTDLADLADRQLVIESVVEDETVKRAVFARLDEVVAAEDAVLATNTSSLPVTRIGAATRRPARVVGVHFFHPVPALPLVEIASTPVTGPGLADRVADFVTGTLGKQVVRSRDRAGFVVNALLVPYLMSAVRMVESGFASAEDVDRGMSLGCAHPMGPLRLADMIGLDTLRAVADGLYAEFQETQYAPPPMLAQMVENGQLGRKSGRGFYVYH